MEKNQKTTVAVVPSPPALSVNISEIGTVEFDDFEGKFLQVVLDALGWKYNVVVPNDKTFGDLLPNGSCTGMVGMVHRGEADLAYTLLSVTEERTKVANFSTVYAIDACVLVSVIPENLKSVFAFIYPFAVTTWIAILVTLSVMTFTVEKILKCKYTVFETFFKLVASFCRQASMPEDSSCKYKVLLVTWLLFITVISFSYSATLLSFLVRPIKDTSIKTFHELSKAVQKGTYKATFYNHSLSILLNSDDNDLRVLGEIAQRNKWFVEISKRGTSAYIKSRSAQATSRNVGRILYGNRKDLYASEDTLHLRLQAFAYGKNFCCPTKLNSILLRLSGAGLYEKILRDYSLKNFLKTSMRAETSSNVYSLSLSDLLGSFMLLGVGLMLSFSVFLGEVIYGDMHFVCKYMIKNLI